MVAAPPLRHAEGGVASHRDRWPAAPAMKSAKKKARKRGEVALPRFDVATLNATAGDKAFARGEAYFADGRVEILEAERGRVRARVAGTEIYRAELRGT